MNNISSPRILYLFLAFIILFTSLATATLFYINTESTFNEGTYDNTFYNSTIGAVQLNATYTLGNYTSKVFDGGNVTSWDNITWTEGAPYNEELPDNAQREPTLGGVDMNGNVLLLHLNDENGVIADTSGSANNGTVTGATTGVGGRYTTAISFDGTDDSLSIPHSSSLNITDALTIETWINPFGESNITIGTINDTLTDTFEFDTADAQEPSFIPVENDVYAIAYEGPGSDGFITTFSISSTGDIGSALSTFEYDTSDGIESDLLHISDTTYAVAYTGPGNDGFVATLPIYPNGTIDSVMNSLEFDTSDAGESDIVHIGDTTYAIAYTGPGNDGFLITLPLHPNGTIGSIINSFEFDTSNAQEPFILSVTGDIYAIAYSGPSNDGFLITLPLHPNGTIGSVIDTLEFDTADTNRPQLISIEGTTYAISYDGSNGNGFIATVDIAADGQISNTVLNNFEYDILDGTESSIIPVARNVYALSYRGENGDGFIVTLFIQPDGTIIPSYADKLEFDIGDGRESTLLHITGNTYAVAYRGPGDDGFVNTFTIVTHKGIFKAGAYEIDANSTTAFAIANGTLTAPLSPGWNHVVFTYDTTAANDQQQLYVNGQLSASTTFSQPLNTSTHPLTIGEYLNATLDEFALYNRALSASEVLDRYKRGILNLTLFVRSCTAPDCSDNTLWDTSFGTSPGILSLPNNTYLQYRAHFTTESAAYSPELLNVTLSSTDSNAPPSTPLLNEPANNSNIALSSVILNATVADPEGGLLTVFFIGNNDIINTTIDVFNASDVSYNWTGLSDGAYTWSVIANDGTTNTSSETFSFTVSIPSSSSPSGGPGSSSPEGITSSGVETNPQTGQSIRPSPPGQTAPSPQAATPPSPAPSPSASPPAAPPITGAAALEGQPEHISGFSIKNFFTSLIPSTLDAVLAILFLFVLIFTLIMLLKTKSFRIFTRVPRTSRPVFARYQSYKQEVINKDIHSYLGRRYNIPTHSTFSTPEHHFSNDRKVNKKQKLPQVQQIRSTNPQLEKLKEVYKIE